MVKRNLFALVVLYPICCSGQTAGMFIGQVVDPSNRPTSGVKVEALRIDGPGPTGLLAQTDSQGKFTFANIPVGKYEMLASDRTLRIPDRRFLLYRDSFVNSPVIVSGHQRTPYVIKLPNPSGLLKLSIVTPKHEKFPGATVVLRLVINPKIIFQQGFSDQGNASVLMPNSRVTLEVQTPGFKTWKYQSSSGDDQLFLGEEQELSIKVDLQPL